MQTIYKLKNVKLNMVIAKRRRCRQTSPSGVAAGGLAAGPRLRPRQCSPSSCRAQRSGPCAGAAARRTWHKVYTWFAHCVQEWDKVLSKFTCQYAADEKSLNCCRKSLHQRIPNSKKSLLWSQKSFFFEEKNYNIYQKNAKKFT